ncbi:helix-turn-helix transcriptional regulator [Kitasatospora sp. NPDC056184]|uniref:helix-turn-helix transcriptional regulator n=1 Tax=Kitasatospora sp. NPDC056184 TaxID=3345738 RepID=UPI0035DC58B2
MPRTGAGADPARSVRPTMARAVLRTLGPHHAGDPGRRVERLLGDGLPVPERLHARLVAALAARGWPALRTAADRLLAADPLLADLARCGDLSQLLARVGLVEPWFHAGHRTLRVLTDDRTLTVRHLPSLGRDPGPAESLLVCALDAVGTAAAAGRTARVEVIADGAAGRPEEVLRTGASRVAGWRLHWSDGSAATAPRPLDAVRAHFARDPARPWRLPATAALLGVAPRTLQRALAAAGTSHQAQLLAVRLDVAGHLTARTSLPLADIAATAGFTDHAHLTRRFRTHYGCPPSEFRRTGHH